MTGKSLFYFLKHFFFFLIRSKSGTNLNLYNSRRKTDKNLSKIFEIPQIQIFYSLSSKRAPFKTQLFLDAATFLNTI